MRRLSALGLAALTITGLAGFAFFAPYIPAAPTVKVEVVRGAARCVVTWSDSLTTMVRSEVRRRGIRADSTVGGRASDTLWSARGYVGTSLARFPDPCTFGRTYRYEVRDSISGVAFSGWSDSTTIVVPTRKY